MPHQLFPSFAQADTAPLRAMGAAAWLTKSVRKLVEVEWRQRIKSEISQPQQAARSSFCASNCALRARVLAIALLARYCARLGCSAADAALRSNAYALLLSPAFAYDFCNQFESSGQTGSRAAPAPGLLVPALLALNTAGAGRL